MDRRDDALLAAKVKFFRDDYDLTILLATNQNQVKKEEILMQLQLNLFLKRVIQKTNQSSFELRWNSKPEDEIQWVAGLYSFLRLWR